MAITPFGVTPDPFDLFFEAMRGPLGMRGPAAGMIRGPDTDVIETEDQIRVIAELPGFSREDIEIGLENNVLTLSGEKREERREDEEGRYHLAERRYGRFSRSFVLPRDVDQDRISADFEHGILTVRIPKSERARRRRVEIRGGDGRRREPETMQPRGE